MWKSASLWSGLLLGLSVVSRAEDPAPVRQMERLDRGLVAVVEPGPNVVLSWRLLGLDPEAIAFHVDREIRGKRERLTSEPLSDRHLVPGRFGGSGEGGQVPRSTGARWPGFRAAERDPGGAEPEPKPYLSIPLQTLPGHTPNDASVGDLDGDGTYEIVLKQEMRGRDNSQRGRTGQTKLEAYRLDGTFLWRIDLGPNIREGAHYTPFLVYDFDGDGRAEVACKTADGTLDGRGHVIGDPKADYRDERGTVLKGPEFLTVFDGLTGPSWPRPTTCRPGAT